MPPTSTALPPASEQRVDSRVWVISDLQTSSPEESRRCLGTAIDDLGDLTAEFDQLWYLGDAVSGTDVAANRDVATVQVEILDGLEVPARYVMGNHDLDPPRKSDVMEMPFYELVRENPNWRTTDTPEDFYFIDEVGGHTVVFLSDHVAPDGAWAVTHGRIRGDDSRYPYTETDYRAVIDEATATGRPLLTAGHNAFDGGNRAAGLQRWFLPLPIETVLHLYGHAHIGDEKRMPSGSGRDAYQTLSYVDHHQVPQIDIASLEDRRGDVVRSAILETYTDGGVAVHLRDHSNRAWIESYHQYTPERAYTVRLSDGSDQRTLVGQNQRQQLIDVIEFLSAEHALFDRLEVPFDHADSGLAIAAKAEHPDGGEMEQPAEISNGYVVERGMGKPGIRRAVDHLAETCGVTVEFDGLWLTGGQ